ncbi:TPA: hypothetical protein L1L58_000093 [Escherichia coli]|nr:hypothetical protein [Escherichia coli]
MHRIDTKTAQKDKFGAGKNGFTRGNPQTGTPATDLDDDYFDMLQEELCSVVEASGASLEKGRHDQLLTALRALLLSRKNPFGDIKSDGTVKTALENLGLGASAFGLKNFVVFSTAGVSTWTVPDELKSGRKAKVTVIGAGGSGGRSSSGGGGGGGGKAVKLVDLTGIESVPITVGAGGAKPAAGSTSIPGNSGGSSSFGTFCSATGGSGGGNVSGGSSGIGVNGDINTSTGPGTPGAYHSSGSYVSGSGGGAGGPGSLSSSNSDGSDAMGPGGGGSGAATSSTTVRCRPGAGYSGLVLIEW